MGCKCGRHITKSYMEAITMKLDFKSLAFGYSLKNGNSTPAWETSLGQGKGYKLKDDNSINELVKGMVYKAVPSKFVSFKKGKGGAFVSGEEENSALVIAAVFDNVYINEQLIDGGKFILLISKDDSKSHSGRLKLKYGPDNKYSYKGVTLQNQMFLDLVKKQLGLSSNACWFVSDISIFEQDKLVLKTTIINPDDSEEYEDSKAHHEAWGVAESDDFALLPDESEHQKLNFDVIKDRLLKLDNQKFVVACIDLMKEHNLLRDCNLKIMADKDMCAAMFKHNNYNGIFFKLDSDIDENEQKIGQDGRPHYYADGYDIDGVKYAMSSQWRPMTDTDDSRTPFINWIIEQLQKVRFETGYENSFARNRIIFGAPGTGKSFKLNKERMDLLEANADENYERVTFHPDYSYANFVGTYKPVPTKDDDGKDAITYEYVPGPFMRVYVNALKSGKTANPKPYLLIIEEINRANVAAVFGDVFQLLDRVKNVSEYPIMPSQDMKEYLAKPEVLGGSPTDYNIIKIPDNMFIWATMNSADQGVFPMDTAFKRRWDFSYIGIDDAVEEMSDTIKSKKYILGTGTNARLVKWNDLRSAINDVLSSESYNINEDKLLGPYFVSKSVLENEDDEEFVKVFKNKVLMYLFDDAAKQKRKTFFEKCKDEVKGVRYSDLCNQFDTKGVFIFPEEVSKRFTEKPTIEETSEADEE